METSMSDMRAAAIKQEREGGRLVNRRGVKQAQDGCVSLLCMFWLWLCNHRVCHNQSLHPWPQVKPEELAGRVAGLQSDLKAAAKEIEALRAQLAAAKAQVRVCGWWPHPVLETGWALCGKM
jgi:hypothetical protein